jgi:hypothetical protein
MDRPLSLPLLMLWVFTANHHDHSIAADHFTVLAARLDRRSYLHFSTAFQLSIQLAVAIANVYLLNKANYGHCSQQS